MLKEIKRRFTLNLIIYSTLFFGFVLFATFNCKGQTDNKAEEYVKQAEEFRKNSLPDSAIHYYKKASVDFNKTGNVEKMCNAFNQIGIMLTRQSKYEEAKTYLQNAMFAAAPSLDSDNLVIATTYISLGVVYDAEEQFTKSLVFHNKALAIRIKKLGEFSPDVATSYGNMGNVYLHDHQVEKSIEYHLKALTIREKLYGKSGAELAQSYFNLGNAYMENKDYKRSAEYFELALQNKIGQNVQEKDLNKYYKSLYKVYYLANDKEHGDFYKSKSDAITTD